MGLTMAPTLSSHRFLDGLVFGFDVGTGSIGYAVRTGRQFLDVGVLICPDEVSDLGGRRTLRRQRRTLRSRKYRREWFARELEKLGLPRPPQSPHDPISLRVRALNGESLQPEELHAALTHLFKRRGYSKVPWANREARQEEGGGEKKEEGEIKESVAAIVKKLNGLHPCQYLAKRREEIGTSQTESWARKIYWPRERLEHEFRAIVKAQAEPFPIIAAKAEWLLYGDAQPKSKNGTTYHVFFNARDSRNPGVLGLRWPRFDNRGPALDSYQPVDDEGRPLHVVRKNKDPYRKAQWELALMNFRVLDVNTRRKLNPVVAFPGFIEKVRGEWNKKGKVTKARLEKLADPFKDRFLLIGDQKPLTPEAGSGRARYSTRTLALIRREIAEGKQVDPPQPILRRKGEDPDAALRRYLAGIGHPLVRHRLVLFRRLLKQLVARFGPPDMVILEAIRDLALGPKARNEINKRNEEFRKERESAREYLSTNNESASRRSIQRYRLWKEAKGRCPFCLQTIEVTDLGHGADIEHLVPRAVVDCNEFSNLTVAHIKCNRELKRDRTPFAAFAGTASWVDIKDHAERTFSGRKLAIFLSPNAEELVEQKADLQHTAYVARVIRHVTLIQLGWLGKDGRDPTPEKQNAALAFQVTNGQLTSRLRKAWGLNQILHPLPAGKRWDELSDAEQKQFNEKNRGDLRHHALDAMVIACTLPWLAHRTYGATDQVGNHGWWTQDEKQRSKAANPLFPREGQMYEIAKAAIEKSTVRHHVSRSNHRKAYATTLYAKKAKDTYVAREAFESLKPSNLGSIWPHEFAAYCEAAWSRYNAESRDLDAELKKSRGHLPPEFTAKLCFSHFQRWRAKGAPAFDWPSQIRIPIRNVQLISVKDDSAVAPFSSGTHAYVKRTEFKEVRIHLAEDGKSFVPVFVPYWKRDRPICGLPIKSGAKPVAVIRKGQVVKLVKPLAAGAPAGQYRVLVMGQKQVNILPPYIANEEEAKLAFHVPKSGWQPYWPEFVRCLGYELPHPSLVKPQPPRSAKG